jgi:hypothetical protein
MFAQGTSGCVFGEIPRHLSCGFSDDLNEMDQREPKVFVRIVRRA